MQLSHFKFLVVDKTDFACKLAQETLFEIGARDLTHATNLKDAMDRIQSGSVNFVVCEYDFDGENGIDLIKSIRNNGDQKIRQMPVVLLTSITDKSSIFSARDAGVDEIVAKPFTAAALRSRIDAVLNRRRAFIDDSAFSGPDRRRRPKDFDGNDRRGDKIKV